MFFVIAYDIADSKRLARVAKIMEDYGTRVQYSVFEVYADRATVEGLMRRVLLVMNTREDSVRVYSFCRGCEGKMEVIGREVYGLPDEDVVIY